MAPRGTRTPSKRPPAKLRNPSGLPSWTQNPPKLDQNSIKNVIKIGCFLSNFLMDFLCNLGQSWLPKSFQNPPNIGPKLLQFFGSFLVGFFLLILLTILIGFCIGKSSTKLVQDEPSNTTTQHSRSRALFCWLPSFSGSGLAHWALGRSRPYGLWSRVRPGFVASSP